MKEKLDAQTLNQKMAQVAERGHCDDEDREESSGSGSNEDTCQSHEQVGKEVIDRGFKISEDFKFNRKTGKTTLIDKLIKSVFTKDKDAVYDKYPHLIEITRPKMPIISPKGDEVIHPSKFQEQLNLLAMAMEMDR
jgi:hypothetical protein